MKFTLRIKIGIQELSENEYRFIKDCNYINSLKMTLEEKEIIFDENDDYILQSTNRLSLIDEFIKDYFGYFVLSCGCTSSLNTTLGCYHSDVYSNNSEPRRFFAIRYIFDNVQFKNDEDLKRIAKMLYLDDNYIKNNLQNVDDSVIIDLHWI